MPSLESTCAQPGSLQEKFSSLQRDIEQTNVENRIDVLRDMNWDHSLFKQRPEEVKERLRQIRLNQFKQSSSTLSCMISAIIECGDDDDKSSVRVLYRGQKDANSQYFVKECSGKHDCKRIRAEAAFFERLRNHEETLKSKGSIELYGGDLICRPIVLIEDTKNHFGMQISSLYDGDAFDMFSKEPFSLTCQTYLALWDIGSALKYLHLLGFYHGDVKLENIVYKIESCGSVTFSLIDFETANSLSVPWHGGTPNYSSPQCLSAPFFDPNLDSWAFANTVYAAWLGNPLQQSRLRKPEETCRVHLDICTKCNIGFVYRGQLSNYPCACLECKSSAQPWLETVLDEWAAEVFTNFEKMGIRDSILSDFVDVKTNVLNIMKGWLKIDPLERKGPSSFCVII